MNAFEESRFRSNVDKALEQVQSILDTTRHPRLLDTTVDHSYADKFVTAETLTATSCAIWRTILTRLGVTDEQWTEWMTQCGDNKTITLRFQASDACSLLKENVVEIEDPTAAAKTSTTTTTTSSWMGSTTTTTKVTRKIKEAHWRVTLNYSLSTFFGTETDHATTVLQREASTVIVIGGGVAAGSPRDSIHSPIPLQTTHPTIDLNLTWLVQQFKMAADTNNTVTCEFAIDRDTAKTPRRNSEMEQALQFHTTAANWLYKVETFFTKRVEHTILGQHNPVVVPDSTTVAVMAPGTICRLQNITKEPTFNGKQVVIKEFVQAQERYRVEPLHASDGLPNSLLVKGKDLAKDTSAATITGNANSVQDLSASSIFLPVQPLVENGTVMPDIAALLAAHDQGLDALLQQQAKIYPPKQVATKLLSVLEATVVLICRHMKNVVTHYTDAIQYLEALLSKQLIQAIGRQVTPQDFTNFMRHHGRRLFQSDRFAPRPFSYAVRRPGHAPDGMITIEAMDTSSMVATPIDSFVRHVAPSQHSAPLQIPLSAATTVPMQGDWYLHGWLLHQFDSNTNDDCMLPPPTGFSLAARARQFSSFLLVIGTMAGSHLLEPKHAIILQNKDDLVIPLLMEVLPSAKDFKDAIASLSPEQQDFCRAFRAMQLESSVFGMAVIQLKPQLETLLGLLPGSLTKEIQLTQDLMSLFIEYQIPSDLLSFDGPDDTSKTDRLNAVKEHVKAVMTVIANEKEKTISAEELKAEYREAMAAPMSLEAPPSPVAERKLGSARLQQSAYTKQFQRGAAKFKSASSNAMEMGERPFMDMAFKEAAAPPPLLAAPAAAATPAPEPASTVEIPTTTTSNTLVPSSTSSSAEDFTMLPKELDNKLEVLDTDNALRSTVLKTGLSWTLQRQENLLSKAESHHFGPDEINKEKKKAFDLLDAITRSGSLPIEAAELHVIVALSHCFEKDLMETVVQDNINPIAKAEKSALLLASTVHRAAPAEMLASDQDQKRLEAAFPLLFDK